MKAHTEFETTSAATGLDESTPDAIAPDGSEIRFLLILPEMSTVHCSLPPGGVSRAVTHRTVQEIWHFLAGEGEIWRRQGDREEVLRVSPGICLSIPLGTHFQFRNTGAGPLQFFIATAPPWPGAEEAIQVEDHWPVD